MELKQQLQTELPPPRTVWAWLAVCLCCAAWWFVLRLPSSVLGLGFLDDGETLYHAFALSRGFIPYRDDATHHFLGYALPYLLLGALRGFDAQNFLWITAIAVGLTGGMVYLGLRTMVSGAVAFVAALVIATGREPFEVGYFVQYQFNAAIAAILGLTLWGLRYRRRGAIRWAALIAGILGVWDQRGILCAVLPMFGALLYQEGEHRHTETFGDRVFEVLTLFLLTSVAPILALSFVWWHGALADWFTQTIYFPLTARSGSQSLLERLWLGIYAQRYLYSYTPLTLVFAALGLLELRRRFSEGQRRLVLFVLVSAIPLFGMPLLGGRDFDYYCLTWYPWLGILVGLGVTFLTRVFPRVGKLALLLPLLVPLLAGVSAIQLHRSGFFAQRAQRDGIAEVTQYLQEVMQPSDTLYVWGYRLELYTRLGRLSPLRHTNRLFVHADFRITDPDARVRHEFFPYVSEFIESWRAAPPTFVVTYTRATETAPETSTAASFVEVQLRAHYKEVAHFEGVDYTDTKTLFLVFQRQP